MKLKIFLPTFCPCLIPRHNILPNTNSICSFGAMAPSVVLVQWMADFNQLNVILIMFLAAGLFKYVRPFSEHQALKGYFRLSTKNEIENHFACLLFLSKSKTQYFT